MEASGKEKLLAALKGRKLFAGVAIVGAAVVVVGAFGMATDARVRNFKTVPGTVVRTHMDQERVHEDGKRRTVHYVRVTYGYEVGGKPLEGSWIHPRGTLQFPNPRTRFSFRGQAQDFADRFPVGKTVTVHYDPANPEIAFLEKKGPSGVFTLAAGLLILVGAGVGFVFRSGS